LPSPDAHELASLLQRKAFGDEAILERLLDDHDVPDDALGFHVQQAVEKRLKAVLALNEVEFQHTHSIGYLTTLLEHHGIDNPEPREPLEGPHALGGRCAIRRPAEPIARSCRRTQAHRIRARVV
jgi:hypothetical protein